MADSLEQKIISIIAEALRDRNDGKDVSISAEDSMETVAVWDSLSFMSVFLAINQAFGVDPDFDDAIHYTSVAGLHKYLQERIS